MFEEIIAGRSALVLPEIQRITFKAGKKYYRHRDGGYYTLLLITEGTGNLDHKNGRVSFFAGDVFFIPAGAECEYIFDQNGTPGAYAVNFEIIGKHTADGAVGEILYIGGEKGNVGKIVRMNIEQMAEKNEKNADGKELLMMSDLYKIVYELYSLEHERPAERGEIHNGIKYIESNYLDEFEIEEVARKCGMCLSLFYKNFKEQTGLTPVEYKNRLKIDRAIELLEERGHSIEDISKMLNFCNQSYFIRTFKTFMGCTPRQFLARK